MTSPRVKYLDDIANAVAKTYESRRKPLEAT